MSHFVDPSWCARLHAARSSAGQPAADEPVSAPVPFAAPASSAGAEDRATTGAEVRAPLFVKREIPSLHDCELCGTVMFDHNCKIICPNCGYKRDCSDP